MSKNIKKRKSLTPISLNEPATDEERIWAADNLGQLTVKIYFSDQMRAKTRSANTGDIYRRAFKITVAPGNGLHFALMLYKGASSADLERANRVIVRAKAGMFERHGWDRIEKFKNQAFGGWVMDLWQRVSGEPEPDRLKACQTRGCVKQYHGWVRGEQFSPCKLESIKHPSGYYVVHGERDGEQWEAWADPGQLPDGVQGLKAIRDLANDFAWMQGECDRLNVTTLQEVPA